MRDYRPPAAASERARRADVTIAPTVAADLAAVLAFETASFPSWTRWFQLSDRDILIARDWPGTIVATLLFDGPGADTVFLPMLGPAAATIGCVGGCASYGRTRHWHRPGGTRVGDTARPRRRRLSHRLDGPRIVLHPGGIPAVAALPDVPQGHELSPGLAFHPSGMISKMQRRTRPYLPAD